MDPFLLSESATREVFGNIAPWMRVLFYILMTGTLGVLGCRVYVRAKLWSQGTQGDYETDWRLWLRRIAVFALGQRRVLKRSLGGVLHVLLFCGFVILTIGTTLLFIADAGPVDFHRGLYYLFYELTMDVFGIAFCAGCVLAIWRRLLRKQSSLGHGRGDLPFLALLLALGVTGFLIEALRLQYAQVPSQVGRWSAAGWAIRSLVFDGMTAAAAQRFHLGMWWLHAVLIAAFFALLPVSRMLHMLTGPIHIAVRPNRHMGALATIAMEEVEETGRTGAGRIAHFSRRELLGLDACMECGRCQDVCPAWARGKPLSPMAVVTDLRATMTRGDPADESVCGISEEALWACTTCQACVQVCPVLIGHVDLITDMRRYLVGEGRFSGPAADTLRYTGSHANPYGRRASDRFAWAEGLTVPTVESNPEFEYLFWVGCAGSFDPRAQRVTRAIVQLLTQADVNFAVLGKQERCSGDPARRLGDEFLFQDVARQNIQSLGKHRVQRIVTACPHCYNTLRNEYPQFEGHYEVQHHTQLLADLVKAGRLKPVTCSATPITLHDPCYLARANGEVDAPRALLGAASNLLEMPRHGKKTFCCGAGGGRMFFEELPDERVSQLRAEEAAQTGAEQLLTACPFCLNMMSDAVSDCAGKPLEVLDVAERLMRSQVRLAPPRDAVAE